MKVKNTERFRIELFKNMKGIYFIGCDIHELARIEYKDSEFAGKEVTALYNSLQIVKSHLDDNFKRVIDDQYYLTVEEDGCVDIWESVKGRKHFKYIQSVCPDDYTKVSFMMMVAAEVASLVA